MDVKSLAKKYENYIIAMRRDFHQNPELSWAEYRTTEIIERELKAFGIETKRLKNTGAIGILKGREKGKTVALRADIDALELKEETELTFKSTNGYMHACGHDCHTAMLLGAAKILSELKDEIKGNIKFIFQPAEETCVGAKKIIEQDNVLEDVDGIFGMHIWGTLQSSKFNIEKGARMASADTFRIKIKGLASHGSTPHLGIDAVVASSAVVMNLQSIVSRTIDPLEPVVITIGTIKGGDRFNIIANEVTMEGTTRAFSREVRNSLEGKMREIVSNTAKTYGAEGILEYEYCPAPLINDDKLTDIAINSAIKLYGNEILIPMEKLTVSEDFTYFMDKIPGAFAFLGCGNEKIGIYSNHNNKFMVDENALHKGSALYAQFALDFLNMS
ncbi:amidohydrolase [Clostridiaceae bacterium UIB06]|uniref:Amidohydrolase n=1 Tax=Clostridium thailandense TaxID=2794346 RepID=A0A949TYS3_9CLOT|nr:amidohydrolase [Clostridium thailandense]MBV7274090.1 amidohydrolase [Clostridium thailandense]MCH5137686.1 amidohydrolase [Clostridiaceae bacterium UIB06]